MNQDRLAAALQKLAVSNTDSAAWDDIYTLLWPFAFAIMFRSLGGNRTIAEDAVQEVMLRLFRVVDFGTAKFVPETFIAYFRRICRSVIVDLIRRNASKDRQTVPLEELNPSDFVEDVASPEERVIAKQMLDTALDLLEPSQRELFDRLAQGYDVAEIARIKGIRPKTAANTVSAMRKHLRFLLFG